MITFQFCNYCAGALGHSSYKFSGYTVTGILVLKILVPGSILLDILVLQLMF